MASSCTHMPFLSVHVHPDSFALDRQPIPEHCPFWAAQRSHRRLLSTRAASSDRQMERGHCIQVRLRMLIVDKLAFSKRGRSSG
jgi:hypothetical protein